MDTSKGNDSGKHRRDVAASGTPDFRYESGDAPQPWYVTGGQPPELRGTPAAEERSGTAGSDADAGRQQVEDVRSRWGGRRASIVGAVLAGVAATALGVGVVEASGSSGGATAAANSRFSGGGVQGGQVPGGPDGETHVTGTLTAVTASSVTVRQTSGTTATYTVDSSTQVLDNGKTVAVTALSAGDQVLVHAFPTNGGTAYAERVLAGSSATADPMGGMPPGGPDDGSAGDGTTSGTTKTT